MTRHKCREPGIFSSHGQPSLYKNSNRGRCIKKHTVLENQARYDHDYLAIRIESTPYIEDAFASFEKVAAFSFPTGCASLGVSCETNCPDTSSY